MNGQLHKALRRNAREAAQQTAAQIQPGVEMALEHEAKTRYRVGQLESRVEAMTATLNHLTYEEAFRPHSFLGRLKWLLRG
jgi:hypothetical protein